MKLPEDVACKSFEEALQELEEIVAKLESGRAPLEESITLYERGAVLKAHCDATLNAAREKVDKIVKDEAGTLTLEDASLGG